MKIKKKDPMTMMIDEVPKQNAIEQMPLTTYKEYEEYNAAARKENKRLKLCRYPCKPCPIELHPTERVVFGRVDQPQNPLPVPLSNDLIDYNETLTPGKTYDLPRVIINHLMSLGTPVWKKRTNPDGSIDTYISHYEPRFTLRTIYQE